MKNDNIDKEYLELYYNRDDYAKIYSKAKSKWIKKFVILDSIIDIHKDESLLDVGCSSMMFKPYVRNRGGHYFGMDISTKFNPDYITDAEDMSVLDDKCFDWILCSDILEHVSNPLTVLQQARKHCNKIAVVVPNLYRLESIPYLPRKKGDRHITKQSPWKWMQLIRESGFEIIETQGFYYIPSIAFYPVKPLTWIDRAFRNPVFEYIASPIDKYLSKTSAFKYLGQEFMIIAKAQ